eukprot:260323-Ditylum_brightwellii.AAC.1
MQIYWWYVELVTPCGLWINWYGEIINISLPLDLLSLTKHQYPMPVSSSLCPAIHPTLGPLSRMALPPVSPGGFFCNAVPRN